MYMYYIYTVPSEGALMFQILIVLSLEVEASCFPSGEKQQKVTYLQNENKKVYTHALVKKQTK